MRILTLLMLAGVLAGCASTAPASRVDDNEVARVERSARLGGAQVKWLNYPTVNEEKAVTTQQ